MAHTFSFIFLRFLTERVRQKNRLYRDFFWSFTIPRSWSFPPQMFYPTEFISIFVYKLIYTIAQAQLREEEFLRITKQSYVKFV